MSICSLHIYVLCDWFLSAADGCGPLLGELRPFFDHATSVVDAAVAAARPADSPAPAAADSTGRDANMTAASHSSAEASPQSAASPPNSPSAAADFLAPIEIKDEVTEMFLKYLPRLARYGSCRKISLCKIHLY
jgi:hypothetical protein